MDKVTGQELVKLHLRKVLTALAEMEIQREAYKDPDGDEDDKEDDTTVLAEATSAVEDAINSLDSLSLQYDVSEEDMKAW